MSAPLMGRARRALVPALIGGAAVATVAAVGGVAVISPEIVASTMNDWTAPIAARGSTDDHGDFYRSALADRRGPVSVDFHAGPSGLGPTPGHAIRDEVVVASGWGTADTSLLLNYLADAGDPVTGTAVYVLDNNVARPNGGFGTRYPTFGLLGADPAPTPASPGAEVVDVGYEYDMDGNAPAYLLNGVSLVNSLMAHLDARSQRDAVDLPVSIGADGTVVVRDGCEKGCRTADGFARIERVGETTYVSYESEDLPLTRPLRRLGGVAGARIADAIDPALRTVVDFGYPDNDPLANPGRYTSARLVPTARQTRAFVDDFSVAVRTGLNTMSARGEPERESGTGRSRATPRGADTPGPTGAAPARGPTSKGGVAGG
ncbi:MULTISPECIES: PE-PPE domain-containing protein [Mycobacteriaceae]|uniref:PE-PPE domain-containing protein n=1 Tax=Mycobacteriaceae TaxID=1762 RepID=UPI0018D49B90|nr:MULTISPECIES: PE-PPE domain-containing protein [Mycobacteriaceae]MCK0172806.1 PE-PPE domain-containing protein [Mycolicibacterium sp. F2034L]